MNRRLIRVCLILFGVVLLQWETPAPLIYRPGEGWTYEPVGGGSWVRTKAKEQLEVAQAAFDGKDYKLARKASQRTVRVWPFSDYAPEAQYLLAQSLEKVHRDEKAFNAYQTLLEKYPNSTNYHNVLQNQFEIANRFLAGQWFKLWGVIPFFPNMDKTVEMYQKIIKNGPYSPIAPQAQMNIGAAREKQSDYTEAVKAYEKAADRYHDQPDVAATALYKAGMAYNRQAKTAEYDQSVAGKAIRTFTYFISLYPEDSRVAEAQEIIASLKTEQARGSLQIARFYEKRGKVDGALVYYNEVLARDRDSKYAEVARERIDALLRRKEQQRTEQTASR